MIDIHPKNFLIKFGAESLTMADVLAKDKAFERYDDPANSYGIYTVGENKSLGIKGGQKVKIYNSQPINFFAAGKLIDLDDMVIKISDFGKGAIPPDNTKNSDHRGRIR
jgi:hypothetical protein